MSSASARLSAKGSTVRFQLEDTDAPLETTLARPPRLRRDAASSSRDAVGPSGLTDSERNSVIVEQAMRRQQCLAEAHQQRFQAQVTSMAELLEAQSNGLQRTHLELSGLFKELRPHLASSAQLVGQVKNVEELHGQTVSLQQMISAALSKLTKSQAQSQGVFLLQSQAQVASLHALLESQDSQLSRTQRQVAELQSFATHAQYDVQNANRDHDLKLQQTQAQVDELQRQLESTLAAQGKLQEELANEVTQRRHMQEQMQRMTADSKLFDSSALSENRTTADSEDILRQAEESLEDIPSSPSQTVRIETLEKEVLSIIKAEGRRWRKGPTSDDENSESDMEEEWV